MEDTLTKNAANPGLQKNADYANLQNRPIVRALNFAVKFDLDLASNALAIEGYLRGDEEPYPCNQCAEVASLSKTKQFGMFISISIVIR